MKFGIFASFDPCNNIPVVKVKENRGIGTLPNFGIPIFFENTRYEGRSISFEPGYLGLYFWAEKCCRPDLL